jgi:hypothetical protein
MINAALMISLVGIVLFVVIVLTFSRLLKKNEGGFLHLLMSLMYLCWLPIPITVRYMLKEYDFLVVGTVFGTVSLLTLILTMILQASHLSYSAIHYKENEVFWDTSDKWVLHGLLGSQVELLAGVLKGVWSIFVTACFWLRGDFIFFSLGIIFSLLTVAYLSMLIDSSLVRKISFLKYMKLNFIVINLETFGWYLLLTVWLVQNR